MSHIKVLSVDGGGVLGVGPLQFLRDVCEGDHFCTHRDVDAFAGTSAGSIVAGMLAYGFSAEEAFHLYKKEVNTIFKKRLRMPWNAKYPTKNLMESFDRYFKGVRLKDLEKPIFIPYSDFVKNSPRVFDTKGNPNELLSRALTISCSAPTFFPPVDQRYADGGLLANNPALVGGYGAARYFGVEPDEVRVLSLGTSGYTGDSALLPKRMGKLRWLKHLIKFWMLGNEEFTDFQCKYAGFDKYERLFPDVTEDYELDDTDIIDEFCIIWKVYYDRNKAQINKMLKDFLHD